MAASGGNVTKALMAGIFANLGVAIAKFVAFLNTGSAAMLAESVHSVADSSNQALLLMGNKRALREPSDSHPFGYGSERYFWTFVVAVNIFLLGAVFAIHEGIEKLQHPHPPSDPTWNYIALGLGMVFEAWALSVAWREFQHWRAGRTDSLWRQMREAKDLALPTVLFEDSAALVGLLVAFGGVLATQLTHDPVYDASASIVIGVVLLGVAVFLAIESHSLLVGEGATTPQREAIHRVVAADPAIRGLVGLKTLYQGPRNLGVALDLEFDDALPVREIERVVERLESAIRAELPQARHIYIEAASFRRHDGPEV